MKTVATRGGYAEQYFPNSETLMPDEMRIVALGTGRPFLRRSQANASWLVELGNGDKFVFDFGFGRRCFTALKYPTVLSMLGSRHTFIQIMLEISRRFGLDLGRAEDFNL